jgi:ribosome production factor 2
MLRKPTTKAGSRALKKKEAVEVEGAKTCIFLKGTSTSQITSDAMKELAMLKKPDSITFNKRNEVHPFDDIKPLEFFSLKNDASLFCFASHSKKRPHNMVFARLYEHQLLDMFEVGIENFKSIKEFQGEKPEVGNRPLMMFQGDWESSDQAKMIKSIFLDCFTGDKSADKLDLRGISHCMVFTLSGTFGAYKIMLRVYQVLLKKTGTSVPRAELVEMGPSIDFVTRRSTLAQPEMWKEATRVPKLNKVISLNVGKETKECRNE